MTLEELIDWLTDNDTLIGWLADNDTQPDVPVRIQDIRGVVQEIREARVRVDGRGQVSIVLKGGDPL